MPKTTRLPFVCGNCGNRYGDRGAASFITLQGNANVILGEGHMMQCPKCGAPNAPALPEGQYRVEDGKWNLVRQIITDVISVDAGRAQFEELARLLKLAQASGADAEQVAAEIENTTSFTALAVFLRKHPSDRTIGIIGLILAVLAYISR